MMLVGIVTPPTKAKKPRRLRARIHPPDCGGARLLGITQPVLLQSSGLESPQLSWRAQLTVQRKPITSCRREVGPGVRSSVRRKELAQQGPRGVSK